LIPSDEAISRENGTGSIDTEESCETATERSRRIESLAKQ
jgi:hypothetical protein